MLDSVYTIVYLDALVCKIRDEGRVRNKSAYLLMIGCHNRRHEVLAGDSLGAEESQLCIVHMVRNLMRFVFWKDRKVRVSGQDVAA